jgi:hypothetical protein
VAGKPPFDPARWSFFLIAGVIATHCLVVLSGVAFCWIHSGVEHEGRCSGLRGQLAEALTAALAAAMAFAGGFTRPRPPDDPSS